jgi:hypothetical protein
LEKAKAFTYNVGLNSRRIAPLDFAAMLESKRHYIWRVFISLLLGFLLTLLAAVLAGLGGGACHCNTPLAVLFPYTAIALDAFSWESIGGWLMLVQFPLYLIIIRATRSERRSGWTILILLTAHIVAASMGLRVSQLVRWL